MERNTKRMEVICPGPDSWKWQSQYFNHELSDPTVIFLTTYDNPPSLVAKK
jgi:hypothetical protein